MGFSGSYYRVMLGKKSAYAERCIAEGFIGVDFTFDIDLTGRLPEGFREFNKEFIPYFLQRNPGKSRVVAGLACGMTHTLAKSMQQGDVVICPDGGGEYYIGTVVSDYIYRPGEILPHRRAVQWSNQKIRRSEMSETLRSTTGSSGTVVQLDRYVQELDLLINHYVAAEPIFRDESVEDLASFAMEKHLEEFLVKNWAQSELGRQYEIYQQDGELIGQQYLTDTGPLDILAISKDRKMLLVVELKRGRASDVVVGQILRYMGYVQDELAEDGQTVRGVIIALEDDQRLQRALSTLSTVEFYRYKISFRLVKS